MALQNLLGDELLSHDDTIATESIMHPKLVVGLYFSAQWCPPCRGFTPKLIDWCNSVKDNEDDHDYKLEVIFVSSDRDEASFKEYFKEMPFFALPFSKRELKNQISNKFRVQGIPSLVLLNATTGEVFTRKGRDEITQDPFGKRFPYLPTPLNELLDCDLLTPTGSVSAKKALEGKVKAFYFSAAWCPPCKIFTPKLMETYVHLKNSGKNFEVIYVPSDRNPEQFNEYYYGDVGGRYKEGHGMPWLSFKYDDEKTKALAARFEIEGIPNLIILNEHNMVVTTSGREAVLADPTGENFPWYPAPLKSISEMTVEVINEGPCLLFFTENSEDQLSLVQSLVPAIEEHWAMCDTDAELIRLHFLYEQGLDQAELVNNLKDFFQFPHNRPLVAIVDVPNQTKFILKEVHNVKNIETLINYFTRGRIDMKPLRTPPTT